jgi:hypothetical protein
VAVIDNTSTFVAHLFEALLVAHPEAVLFVQHEQAQVAEDDVLAEHAVRAHDDVDAAGLDVLDDLGLCWSACTKRLSSSTRHGVAARSGSRRS